MAGKRKVLFVTFDQWRGDALGANGGVASTPAIDAFARQATVFRNHFTCSAPCGPSRATLLTGRYPFIHRSVRNGSPLDERFTNLAKEARALGIEPLLFGYTDTSIDPRSAAPRDPALRSYEGVLSGFTPVAPLMSETDVSPWAVDLKRKGYTIPKNPSDLIYAARPQKPGTAFHREPAPYRAEDSDTAFTADAVADYIQLNADKEWLIHASFLRPHPPLLAPEPYNSMFDAAAMPSPQRATSLAEEASRHPFMEYWLRQLQSAPDFFQSGFAPNTRS